MAHLDAPLKAELLKKLKSLQAGPQVTSVYITHDRAEAEALTPHIVTMDKGHLAATSD